MSKYILRFTETVTREVEVEADSAEQIKEIWGEAQDEDRLEDWISESIEVDSGICESSLLEIEEV